jgi:hypothetical protein
MKEFEPMKRGEWGFPAVQKPETVEAQAQKNEDLRDAMDDEGDMLTIAWLDGFHRGKEKRPWVGLTDEEVLDLFGKFTAMTGKSWLDLYRMTEAKLKEKNA